MNKDEKAAVVDELAGQLAEAQAVFAVDYRGISVRQVGDLRVKLREVDATFRVVKNSLTERAADKAGAEQLKALLDGPTALTFVRGDAALAAKALSDAIRTTQVIDFKGGVMNGAALSADDIRSIARLPSRDVLYGQLVGMVASPLTGLARGLNGLISGVAIALQAIHDRDLLPGDRAAAPAPVADEPAAAEPVEADAEPNTDAPTPDSTDDDNESDAAPDADDTPDAKEEA